MLLRVAFLALVALVPSAAGNRGGLCSVYDPFKVLPDNNKYQIGGAFPLHDTNCIWLLPDTVQDIVAIQWALTHWNQNPDNAQAKMGLYAGDTCSRPKEAISQSLRFLDSVGYHEPDECVQNRRYNGSQLISLIAPKDRSSSDALGTLLKTTNLPVAAYSEESVRTLVDLGVTKVISTTPTLGVFVEAFLKLMGSFRSNLVTIVDTGEDPVTLRRIIDQLKASDLFVAEVIPFDHPLLVRIIGESDSNVVLSLIKKDQLFETFARKELLTLNKLWVAIPLDGEGLNSDDQTKVLKSGSRMQVISLQTKAKNLNQFKDYFIRVLKNNFQSYSLLTSYVQQVFNCSLIGTDGFSDCASLDKEHMASLYSQSKTVGNVVILAYAMAVVGAQLEADKELRDICERPTQNCTDAIISQVEKLDYTFGANDPAEFVGEKIQFYRSVDGVLISSGIVIEGIELVNDDQMGPMVYKMLEYETGRKPRVLQSNIRRQDSRVRSVCAPYRPFCGQCEHIVSVKEEKYFLSIPKQYPIYVAGLFDLHEGEACQILRKSDISMPMAFVHTVWTFRQRYSHLNLLKNLDFGALIMDACTSGKKAIELIVQSENHCFKFNQASRNITVVPGSTFGYISGVTGNGQEAVQRYFSSGHSDVPLVSIDGEHNTMMDTFTTFPSNRKMAIAVLKLLKKMQWEFVTVVLSEQNHDSLAAFHHFERLATDRGVCMAEVINISGENVPDTADSSVHSTNVTVMFTTAKDAAMYLGNRLRRGDSFTGSTIHLVVGDAHDWYLYHDRTNLANYVGTVSVQPKDVLYSDFKHWLEMTTPLTLPEQWYWRHVEDRWQCALSLNNKHLYGDKMCNGDELLDVPSLGRMTKTGYLARGLERFLFAMDAVYKRLCPEQTGICVEFYTNGRKQVLNILKKTPVEDDFEIYEFLPMEGSENFGYKLMGNWSTTGGLRFSDTYRTFVNGAPKSGFVQTSKCIPPLCKCFLDTDFFSNPLNAALPISEEPLVSGSYVRREPAGPVGTRVAYASVFEHITSGQWRTEPYNFVLLFLASLLLITVIAVLILVCVKMYCKVVKGNQSLGITLLVGIGFLYVTSFFFIFDATDAICRCRIIFHSIGYTICFGVMIAKASQLRNAETLGFAYAIHISYWNYWMLLFFIVGVQIALSVRWISESYLSSIELGANSTRMICSFSHFEFLLAQSYVVILLILALFINSRNRNIKRNYKETKWLFLASLCCVLLWAFWVVVYLLTPGVYRDIVIVLELLICGTVLLGFLFGPKIYILLSYEPVIVECHTQTFGVPNDTNEYGLFERGVTRPLVFYNSFADDDYHTRAVSPASSTDSGTRSTVCSGHHAGQQAPNSNSSCGTCSDDQSPIFHTVMRKKNRIRRSQSEHEYNKNSTSPVVQASPTVVHNHVFQSPRDSPASRKLYRPDGVLQS
ncbi:hypothetical protein L596_004458 [Steinernema carpocapsae]|uniref:G-protein coupled receptors family 3 profile domain-containing protein n=1 Tax=Steinernema carpocapsae TaxID=34508 RepID=A0A4U8UVU2_STECR|nr:hypothetical protein L596_004458 [Steinernema carpocapsae]